MEPNGAFTHMAAVSIGMCHAYAWICPLLQPCAFKVRSQWDSTGQPKPQRMEYSTGTSVRGCYAWISSDEYGRKQMRAQRVLRVPAKSG